MKRRHQHQENLNQEKELALKNTPKRIEFSGAVEFGIPSKDCKNYGICSINKLNNIPANFKKKLMAVLVPLHSSPIGIAMCYKCNFTNQAYPHP